MKIGIDIDGVILDSENLFRVKGELYDLIELHKDGVVNEGSFYNRYDWSEAQFEEFHNTMVEATKEATLMPGAKQVLNLLKQDGHELIIITTRGLTIKGMQKAVEEKFDELDLNFDKYYFAVEDKEEVCKKENIDVMIDDKASICKATSENGIRTLYFRDVNRPKLEEKEYLKEVNHWGEIYRYIYNLNLKEN